MKDFYKRETFLIILLILISLFPLKDLLTPGAYQSHDIIEHAARLASFYESLQQGNPIPRWGGNLNYTYGHPVIMFLYPLTNYLGSFLHFLGFSIINSIKILFGISYIASGVFMYLWIKRLWGEKAGFIAAIFYLFAPYRFVDLYVRAALGEHLAFVFIPLVCWMLTELIKTQKKKYLALSSISIALLILSHNAISLIFMPFIVIYGLFLIYQREKKIRFSLFHCLPRLNSCAKHGRIGRVKQQEFLWGLIVPLLLGLALSSFFWLPALVEGKYTLREIVADKEIFINNYLKPGELFFSKWGYGGSSNKEELSGFMVSLSWFQWLAIFISVVLVFIKKNKDKLFLTFLLIYLFLAIFFTNTLSKPFVNIVPLVSNFQFPWRLLSVPVFICGILAGYLVFYFRKKLQLYMVFIFCLIVILSTVGYWQIKEKGKTYSDDYFLQEYTGTTETGESTPRWAIRFQESYPYDRVQLVYGGIDGHEIEKWNFEEHRYTISIREDSQIVDNTLYFPGWKVWVNEKEVPINYQDLNWRGMITYPVPVGEHQVVVKFTRTKVRLIADIISLISLIGLISLIIFYKNEK